MVDLESWQDVPLGEGRIIEVLTTGPESGVPLVFNTGSPGGAASFGPLAAAARSRGFRLVHYSRPGFGRSTADPGRSVADAARDVAAVLDAIGAAEFVTIGWSGGGPHGLACAAAMPDRCLAVASVSGFAPFGPVDLDFFAGMEESNTEEYSLAIAGGAPHALLLEKQAPKLAGMQWQPLDEVAQRDPAAADIVAFREFLASTLRRGLQHGTQGWRDDDLAFMRPWRFDPALIRCPVAVWGGEKDVAVPPQHGRWLASHIPGARAHFDPDLPGHGVLFRVHFREIVDELADLANLPRH